MCRLAAQRGQIWTEGLISETGERRARECADSRAAGSPGKQEVVSAWIWTQQAVEGVHEVVQFAAFACCQQK